MRKINTMQLLLLSLTAYLFTGCVKQETTTSVTTTLGTQNANVQNSDNVNYGEHSIEIESILSTIPLGSEIYLEEKENAEWYLKIEKTFTSHHIEEKKVEPIYGETILI